MSEETKNMVCRVCSPIVEIQHVVRPVSLSDGKDGDINVWTCSKCFNQKREEKQADALKGMEVERDENGRLKKISSINENGDEEGILFENVEAKPNDQAILPQEIIDALGLRMVFRMVGVALEHKIPLYETNKGMAVVDYMNKATSQVYITRYDLIGSPPMNLILKKQWCIYMEREINGKVGLGGVFVDEIVIDNKDIEKLKSLIREINTALNKKFGN